MGNFSLLHPLTNNGITKRNRYRTSLHYTPKKNALKISDMHNYITRYNADFINKRRETVDAAYQLRGSLAGV
jgi:isochorismate hydrolase